jgi:hypothetical protein
LPAHTKPAAVRVMRHLFVALTHKQYAYLTRRTEQTGETKSALIRLLLIQDMLHPMNPIR